MELQRKLISTIRRTIAKSALCAVLFCSGCLKHRVITTSDAFRLDDRGGVTMLVPDVANTGHSEELQTTKVMLPAGSTEKKIAVSGGCSVRGQVFSLAPGRIANGRSWLVQSPSISGWDILMARTDVGAQWREFVRELVRMHGLGCFPAGLSVQFVRTSIAESIPLPADVVLMFLYSERGERFVDLAPDMEIRIQKVLETRVAERRPSLSLPMLTVDYEVVSRHRGTVGLKLIHHDDGGYRSSLSREDRRLLSLDQRFASKSVLRLFLQGLPEGKQDTAGASPMLIGATDAAQLDLLREEPAASVCQAAELCVDLPAGGVSLFSVIWLNGHRTSNPFGTSLGSILLRLPDSEQEGALQSVQVLRKLSSAHYARIEFKRTIEDATQLLLLPGDRVDWKH